MTTIKHYNQESAEDDKPPDIRPRPVRPWRVAVIANIKGETPIPEDAPPDAGAEFDSPRTIQAIREAIESDGHTTIFLQADSNLPQALREYCPDICFNIAEGLGGDGREAQVPALLEMLKIPYTASRVVTSAISLEKTLTKRIWRDHHLPTAAFQEFETPDDPISPDLHYPLFVKPVREGTGMGTDEHSVVFDELQLRQRVRWVIETYRQPALVEAYLSGREFTVAVMGSPHARQYSRHPEWYAEDGFHRFPIMEIYHQTSVTPGIYGHEAKQRYPGEEGAPLYLCPAAIDEALAEQLNNLAIRAHQAIGALDISRVDIRLGPDGKPYLMEINTLPGLSPGYSDLCMIAAAEGITYRDLILEILYLGAARYGLLNAQPPRLVQFKQRVPIHTTTITASLIK